MKHAKKCWLCGKQTMEPKGSYYQCSECGATWNEIPLRISSPLDEHDTYIKTLSNEPRIHIRQPSAHEKRSARKARESAREKAA